MTDLRFALRTLTKNPRFTAVAVLALALGIGANTAVFSVVHAVLLRPLPYHDPDRLVVVLESSVRTGGWAAVAPANFFDWRDQNRAFESMAAAEAWGGNLTGKDRPEQVSGLRVSGNLFTVLGVKPILGRTFLPEDEQPGKERVLVLSYRLWQRRFGGDPAIIGQTLALSGDSFTVVGVMPPGFQFAPFWQTKAEMWAPLAFTPERAQSRGGQSLRIFARLKPGVTLEQARVEMRGIARRLEQQYPRTNTDRGARVTPLHEMAVGNVRPALLLLLGAVAFILLIACANVANLLLTRAATRQREIAVRLALGAGRLQLVRQLLAESVLLSVAGGAAGLLLAWWGLHALVAAAPDIARFGLPRRQEVGLNLAVLSFTFLLSLAAAVVFGLAPALQASKTDLVQALKLPASLRLRVPASPRLSVSVSGLLVVGEIALSLMLLAGAGLMIRSFQKLHALDPGFNPHNVLTMAVSVAGSRHAEPAGRAAFYHRLAELVEAVPGVESVSAINHIPLAGDLWTLTFTVEGRPAPPPGQSPGAVYRVILPNYIRTMGISLVTGRDFTERDTRQAPGVVIINESMARRCWPREDPIGKRIKMGEPDSPLPWLSIAGVARDARQRDWVDQPGSEMYLPYYQVAAPQPYTTLVVRTARDPAILANALQSAIWAADKDLPISGLAPMEQIVADSMWQPRFSMLLLGAFAALALVLAAVGIYGMMSYTVSRRTHEIGIRMALGARPADVLKLVIGRAALLALIGTSLGSAAALALTRTISGLLYGVKPADPATFAGAAVLLAGVALAACYLPARRAAKVDPIVALRYE